MAGRADLLRGFYFCKGQQADNPKVPKDGDPVLLRSQFGKYDCARGHLRFVGWGWSWSV